MAKKHEPPLDHCLGELLTHNLTQEAEQLSKRGKKECGDDQEAQVRFLNRHFRDTLSKMDTDTIDAREALLDDCPPKEWNGLFTRYVIPALAKKSS